MFYNWRASHSHEMDINRPYHFEEGEVLLIHKPIEWTSFDVVNKIRNALRKYCGKKLKVGHAGTLDPLADGLLLIATGKATKQIQYLQAEAKAYEGIFTLGATTPSYDLETEIDKTFETNHITNDLIHQTTKQFIGKIKQVPPIFSALKVDGERAYKKARLGETIQMKERDVEFFDFKILNIDLPRVDFQAHCSKGTYIRSLAHDFGRALNSGAHLSKLTRTAIGDYQLKDAWLLNDFIQFVKIPRAT